MSDSENLEDNPAEPVPNEATAAEPGQPVEPELEPISLEPQEDDMEAEDESFEGGSLLEIDKALHFYETSHHHIPFLSSLNNEEPIHKKFSDKFTQTFFKFMKNLSDRRFIEIIRQDVDHEDTSLVFYCSSSKLLLTFQL